MPCCGPSHLEQYAPGIWPNKTSTLPIADKEILLIFVKMSCTVIVLEVIVPTDREVGSEKTLTKDNLSFNFDNLLDVIV